MRRGVWGVGCLLALLGLYLTCPFRLGIVCGSSMEPSYHSGQPILIDRNYYRYHPIARGDVVLLHAQGATLIKRVFACPGDSFHVAVMPDETHIDRYIVGEGEVGRLRRVCRLIPGQHLTRVTVLSGYVYVLGDNPSVSVDSRDFGMVPFDQLIGHVADRNSPAYGARDRVLLAKSSTAHGGANGPYLARAGGF